MIVSVHQPQYMPWLGFIDKIRQADVFVLLDSVQFKKNEWQNRNRICTPQGEQWMTVPVIHHFGEKINEVKIDNKNDWRKSHIRSLEMNYKKAPFFDHYIRHFNEILEQDWEFLSDINICVIRKIVTLLGLETKIEKSSNYKVSDEPNQRLIDLCRQFEADQYFAGQDGPNYMDMDQFKAQGIEVVLQTFNHPVYPQMWQEKNNNEFLSHLSVIDLLLNCGPESLSVISSGSS